ncbi:MAG TPA: hypothetical protein VMV50_03740 [Candidatus Paceibacterota bacterium]|nr:hypothetical protein [Candidatus Paceibacterota bacterium]
MKLWLGKIFVFILGGFTYAVGKYIGGYWYIGQNFPAFCRTVTWSGKFYCNSPYLQQGIELVNLSKPLVIIGIILLFANAAIFRQWLRFSKYYVPIAVALVLLIYPISIPPMTSPTSRLYGLYVFTQLYAVIAFCIVAVELLRGWLNKRAQRSSNPR